MNTQKQHKLLAELQKLNSDDLNHIIDQLKKDIARNDDIDTFLGEVTGKGKGIWKPDAQSYINDLRREQETK